MTKREAEKRVDSGLSLIDQLHGSFSSAYRSILEHNGVKDIFDTPEYAIGVGIWLKMMPKLIKLMEFDEEGQPVRPRDLVAETFPALICVLLRAGMDMAFDMRLQEQLSQFGEGLVGDKNLCRAIRSMISAKCTTDIIADSVSQYLDEVTEDE